MDDKEFDERASRLKQVGKVIESLPSEIREGAFELLKGYVLQQGSAPPAREGDAIRSDSESDGGESVFTRFDHDQPSDNVRLIAAHLFQEYGSEPFTVDEVKALAVSAGITIPERVDMTIVQAKESGKQLFMRTGRGKFKPTVHGEAYLRNTYAVKKGTKTRGTEVA